MQNTDNTARIVAAYCGNNALAASDIPALIETVHFALSSVPAPKPPPAVLEPAVPVKNSVTPDAVICLECGDSHKMLKRHLATEHKMRPDEYRAKWSLPADYSMVAPAYAAKRSQLAKSLGLGRKRK